MFYRRVQMSGKMKQTAIVLDWLQNRGELTTREAVTELNIMSLPRRIMELRRAGHEITMEYRTSNNGARYGVYKLKDEPKVWSWYSDGHPQHY